MKPGIKLFVCICLVTAIVFAACTKNKVDSTVIPPPAMVINDSMIPFGKLSIPREYVCAATAGSKILFAGGAIQTSPITASSRVDIYDTVTKKWATAELSMPRVGLVAVTAGNKIFFTDGFINSSSRVDIYDASTNAWSIAELGSARFGFASASTDDKVVFAGGYGSIGNEVDIYDKASNSWSANTLSEPRTYISSASIGNHIYFSGGFSQATGNISNKTDVYNASTNSWSTITMSEPRVYHTSIGVDNKIFWAGGYSSLDSEGELIANPSVEIYNVITGSRTHHRLSNNSFSAGIMNNKIIFLTAISGSSFPMDVFDMNTQTWVAYKISLPSWTAIGWSPSIVAAGNKIYIVGHILPGAAFPNEVWKLEF